MFKPTEGNCFDCSHRNAGYRCVLGDGPIPAVVMFIGERPGQEENKVGKPFIGKAGREFNENYLHLAGLDREDVYVTNTVKCGAEGNRKPTAIEIMDCAGLFLEQEIEEVQPDFIVLMGATACSLLPWINLEFNHGLPIDLNKCKREFYGWQGTIIPMYHPAAGIHDTSTMIPLLEDFERLGKIIEGKFTGWSQPPKKDYRLLTTSRELVDVFEEGMEYQGKHHSWKEYKTMQIDMAVDTERHGDQPFSLQFCMQPGKAYMILDENAVATRITKRLKGETGLSVLEAFRLKTNTLGRRINFILHNAGQDIDYLEKMGVTVMSFSDTMQEAYHLGNLPQGLKALAYRLMGEEMTTWEDTVLPYSRAAILGWIQEAIVVANGELCIRQEKKLKTKTRIIEKAGEIERALNRIFRYTVNNPAYDPWRKINEFLTDHPEEKENWEKLTSEDTTLKVTRRLLGLPVIGTPPILGIKHVPIEQAVQYGCGDADVTFRLAQKLKQRRGSKEFFIAPGDEDQIL